MVHDPQRAAYAAAMSAALAVWAVGCHRPPASSPRGEPARVDVVVPVAPADAATARVVAAPAVDPAALVALLGAANRRAYDRSQPRDGEVFCGGSAGAGCLQDLFQRRQRVIATLAPDLARAASPPDDATACALRLQLRRQLAVLTDDRDQSNDVDDTREDGYCHCELRPVALPPDLERLTTALAARCPAPVSPCALTMPAAFHLRDHETSASTGPELPAGTSLELLAPQTLRRRTERMYLVALGSDARTGFTFVDPAQIAPGCRLPAP